MMTAPDETTKASEQWTVASLLAAYDTTGRGPSKLWLLANLCAATGQTKRRSALRAARRMSKEEIRQHG